MVAAISAIHRHDSVGSTMDLAHQLAEGGAPSGTVVVAAEQTAGRGSRGRTWYSPRGGLWLSLVLRPERDGGELLSLRAGLALAEALERAGQGLPVAVKWPNDLMVGDRKLGGVLCEARWMGENPGWVVVGVGINVRNRVPEVLATALTEWVDITPEHLLEQVLPGLRGLDAGAAYLAEPELARLSDRDWLRGRALESPVRGVAAGIAADGALMVRAENGTLTMLRGGTIELAGPPTPP